MKRLLIPAISLIAVSCAVLLLKHSSYSAPTLRKQTPPTAFLDTGDRYAYAGGEFTRFPNTAQWFEDGGRYRFDFVEERRDPEAIVLRDASRNLLVRLPIQGGWATWSNTDGREWHGLKNVERLDPQVTKSGSGGFTPPVVRDGGLNQRSGASRERRVSTTRAQSVHSLEIQMETQLRALEVCRDVPGDAGDEKRRLIQQKIDNLQTLLATVGPDQK